MALNTLKCNRLTPLPFKGLKLTPGGDRATCPIPRFIVESEIFVCRLNVKVEVRSPIYRLDSFGRHRHIGDRCRRCTAAVGVGGKRPEVARLAVRPRDR